MDTLVLNSSYVPIHKVSWHRAFNMAMQGRVEVLEFHPDALVRSFQEEFPVPSVIRCLRHTQGLWRKKVVFNRKNVWQRDLGRCQYCGKQISIQELTLDHVKPVGKGGTTCWRNIVSSCKQCNQDKGCRTPKEAAMPLLKYPKKPNGLFNLTSLLQADEIPVAWGFYLNL